MNNIELYNEGREAFFENKPFDPSANFWWRLGWDNEYGIEFPLTKSLIDNVENT